MQAHAPKHHGGSIEYLERHLLALLLTLGILAAGVLAAIAITSASDDAETIAVPDVVAPSSGDTIRYLEQNTELPPYTGVPAITGGPGDVYPHDSSIVGSRDDNGMLRSSPLVQDYSLDWARFLEANGVSGALTEPVVSIQHQRFLEENIYLPGYEVETQTTTPLSGEDVPLYLPGNTPTPFTNEDILFLEQNLYLPSDGVGFIDLEPLPMPVERRADLKAYYEAGMGQGWFAYGRQADATDDAAQPGDTSNRRKGAEVGRAAPDGRHSKGKR